MIKGCFCDFFSYYLLARALTAILAFLRSGVALTVPSLIFIHFHSSAKPQLYLSSLYTMEKAAEGELREGLTQ